MRHLLGKIFLGIGLVGNALLAYAANAAPTQTQVTANNTAVSDSAINFANQAGNIAGAAQACGQDISAFSKRVTEAVYRLTNDDGQRMLALAAYQKTLQQAQSQQMTNAPIPCNQVLQDFSGLPLMRADYEQTVMPQLGTPPATTTQVTANTTTTTPPTVTTPTAPTTVSPNNQLQQSTSISPVKPTVPPLPAAARQSASQVNTSFNNPPAPATPNPALTPSAPAGNNVNPALSNPNQGQAAIINNPQVSNVPPAMNSTPPPNYPTPAGGSANPNMGYQAAPSNMPSPTAPHTSTPVSPSSLPPVPNELQPSATSGTPTQVNVNGTSSAAAGQ